MCLKRERWIKTLQGRVKFVAVSFSVVSVLGLCILFILYFASALPIAISQLIGKVIYVIMTLSINVLLYQGARYKNVTYLKIWLGVVMLQILVTFGYGSYAVYLCTIRSASKLITLPVLCFTFGVFHLLIWLIVLKFKKEVTSEHKTYLDIEPEETDKQLEYEQSLCDANETFLRNKRQIVY